MARETDEEILMWKEMINPSSYKYWVKKFNKQFESTEAK